MNKTIKSTIRKFLPESILNIIRKSVERKKLIKVKNIKVEPYKKGRYLEGINLVASIQHDTGLGQSSRLVASELQAAKIPFNIVNFKISNEISGSNHDFDNKFSTKFDYTLNLIHINMGKFPEAIDFIGKENIDRHYNIAFWLWEMENFPKKWVSLINVLDEIWTPSEFISNSIRKVTDKPVITIPYHVTAPIDKNLSRKDFELPEDKFLFLIMFDKHSLLERKNPMGAISAFKKAFEKDNDDIGLVIKINNASEEDKKAIREELKGYNVYFINRIMSKLEVNRLIQLVDVYVSLHRAEGFGLVLAESMILGTPTIATGYSSNIEFQNKKTACLVNYDKIAVGKEMHPYLKNDLWAEPNIKEAAEYMVKLYKDREFYNSISKNAKEYIGDVLSMDKIVDILDERVKYIKSILEKE